MATAKANVGDTPPNIVVGVAGGIAAYKAVSLVRELVLRGATVTVIPTASALKFVGVPTWEAISRNAVPTSLFDAVAEVRHVALGQNADLVIVAPATAHTLASMAAGLAPDLLGTTLLATRAPVLVAPAMHTEMWEHPSVVANMSTLMSRGIHAVGPESGALTGQDVGLGRMAEPEDIAEAAWNLLGAAVVSDSPWAGKNVVISAGGTREYLDPVRFMGNRSTGEMGVSLARAAVARGATVTLVAANLEVALPGGIEVVHAPDAASLEREMVARSTEADVVIMAAAVADWVPVETHSEKLTKSETGETWSPELRQAPDILATLGAHKPSGQLLVGFAAETSDDGATRESHARDKMARKKHRCDGVESGGTSGRIWTSRNGSDTVFHREPAVTRH